MSACWLATSNAHKHTIQFLSSRHSKPQHLLFAGALWNPNLLQHATVAQEVLQANGHYTVGTNADKSGCVLFRGVRVRMGIATGVVEVRRVHKMTQRVEYAGQIMRKVQAIADTPDGGQVGRLLGLCNLHQPTWHPDANVAVCQCDAHNAPNDTN